MTVKTFHDLLLKLNLPFKILCSEDSTKFPSFLMKRKLLRSSYNEQIFYTLLTILIFFLKCNAQ